MRSSENLMQSNRTKGVHPAKAREAQPGHVAADVDSLRQRCQVELVGDGVVPAVYGGDA
jgi:hypothetical protein